MIKLRNHLGSFFIPGLALMTVALALLATIGVVVSRWTSVPPINPVTANETVTAIFRSESIGEMVMDPDGRYVYVDEIPPPDMRVATLQHPRFSDRYQQQYCRR